MRDIPGYEGLYTVTSCGKIWSCRRHIFMKTRVNRGGYEIVNLHKDGVQTTHTVHQLVALAYLPNPDNLPQVNHKDEVKTHNYINNLEWCDCKYNNNYGSRANGGRRAGKPVRCVEIGEVYPTANAAALAIGKDRSGINKCCRGERKTAHGYHWEYAG